MQKIVRYFGGLYIDDDCSGEEPVYLEKESDYVESESTKADKRIFALMKEQGIANKHQWELVQFIRNNAEELVELVQKLDTKEKI